MFGGCSPDTCTGKPGHLCAPDVLEPGDDVTYALKVEKWEPKESTSGATNASRKSTFPGFIPKTDEIRIQSAPKLLKEILGRPHYITEKLDGTSFTAYSTEEGIEVCSRNQTLREEDNAYWQVAKKYDLATVLKDSSLAIQGEVCGPGIQGNKLGLKEIDLFVFDIFDIPTARYLNIEEVSEFCKKNNLKRVPLLLTGEAFNYSLEGLLEAAEGKYASGREREGIVIRSNDSSPRISFKVISNKFLLKEEK